VATEAKEMLKRILTTATLTAKDREVMEGMWDQAHRAKLTHRQYAWVQDIFYKQKLDQPGREPPKRAPKMMVLKGKVPKTLKARSLEVVRKLLPGLPPDSPLDKKLQEFFASGGELVEIRPVQ
jgi:hypothetical protein